MQSNRQWIKATIAHQETAAVPYNFPFSPLAQAALEKHYGTDDLEDSLDLPIRMAGPGTIKPLFASPEDYGRTVTDEFGVTWSTSHIDRGSPIGPPLAEADLSAYTFPDPADEHRFEGLPQWCLDNRGHFTIIWVGDLWERATFMRGMENILLDLRLSPRFVERLLRRLADHILATMEILFDRCQFDAVALSDDYGTQKAMLMSRQDWCRLLRPLLAEIYGLARKHGRHVLHHTCGNVAPIIPDMIEAGLDILHPIQPEAMDIHRLKSRFGRDLTLWGGLGTQDLLPRGTPGQIRREVQRLKETMGQGGGYVLAPGITIQADVPLANILALIEEARAIG